jgi:hypothetical protein
VVHTTSKVDGIAVKHCQSRCQHSTPNMQPHRVQDLQPQQGPAAQMMNVLASAHCNLIAIGT